MKIIDRLEKFESLSSISERMYNIINFLLTLLGSTTLLGLLRYIDPYFKSKSYLFFFGAVVLLSLIVFAMLYLFKAAKYKQAKENYLRVLSETKLQINPLEEVFEKQVIYLEQLRLPLNEPQKNKTFRHCRLIGPLTIFIYGGNFSHCGFMQSGDVIALPANEDVVNLAGVLILQECNLFECTFVNVTILVPQHVGRMMQENLPGCRVIGLS
ncbi:hypothetical protein [Enterobacter sp.]|uniref:hypothetical protein n=1 Tax=Enterobacter sp. TaxID=42895 RepID=UPI00296FA27E|nr:hypothetical protein [Enterobacter sp.]